MFAYRITVPLTCSLNPATFSTLLQIQRYGFGDPKHKADTAIARFFCVRNTARPLWAGRVGDLRVCRLLVAGSPTCTVRSPCLATGRAEIDRYTRGY